MKPPLYFRRTIYLAASLVVAGIGLFLLMVAMPATASQPAGVPNAVVFMKAPSEEITVGDEITVTVAISDVVGLYGIQFTLNFTPANLQVIDANPALAGVQIASADCPEPELKVANVVNNTAGTIEYSVSQLGATPPPVNGDCAVAHIRFKTLEVASTPVRFAGWLLSDDDFSEIPADAVDLLLEIEDSGDFYVYLPIVIK
jgi:hypothetical protein